VYHLERVGLPALTAESAAMAGMSRVCLGFQAWGGIFMIVELAQLTIAPGREAEFEAVFRVAITGIAATHGYLAHELRRSVETPNRYVLRVEWATLEDHTVAFRGSPAFPQWRAHVGPFFEAPPVVEHFQPVTGEEV
jgi:heme-degrading monooxygenase HmoA